MPGIRDHEPIVIEDFNGWWDRGDPESVPSDHFTVAENIQYFNSGVETRVPIDKYQAELAHITGVRRVYNYVMQEGQSLLVLDSQFNIWHIINGAIRGPAGNTQPILSLPAVVGPPAIAAMEDFGFVAIAGRAYITPFHSIPVPNQPGAVIELGVPGRFLYVYKGDGTLARKAGGFPPSNKSGGDQGKRPFIAYNSPLDGKVTQGIHIIAVAVSVGGGAPGLPGPDVFPTVESPGGRVIQLDNIPQPPGISSRTLMMTKALDPKNYKPAGASDYAGHIYYRVETTPWTDLTTNSRKIKRSFILYQWS